MMNVIIVFLMSFIKVNVILMVRCVIMRIVGFLKYSWFIVGELLIFLVKLLIFGFFMIKDIV